MSYNKLVVEQGNTSSDEFDVKDEIVSFHAPMQLEEMANTNFGGPPDAARSGSSKAMLCLRNVVFCCNFLKLCFKG